MKAFLYGTDGQVIAATEVADPPPDHLDYNGIRFVRAGSSNRLDEDGVEQVGWAYRPEQFDGRDDA